MTHVRNYRYYYVSYREIIYYNSVFGTTHLKYCKTCNKYCNNKMNCKKCDTCVDIDHIQNTIYCKECKKCTDKNNIHCEFCNNCHKKKYEKQCKKYKCSICAKNWDTHCKKCNKCKSFWDNKHHYCNKCKICYEKKYKKGIICNKCKKCIHNKKEHDKIFCIDKSLKNLKHLSNDTCCICLDTMNTTVNIKLHCCNNLIHLNCINKYIEYKNKYCLLCKS